MVRIYDITDYVKEQRITLKKFIGKIAVDENGWFEGYLKRINKKYINEEPSEDDYHLIFGIYHKGEILDLYYCNGRYPKVFKGKLDNNRFLGNFKTIGDYEYKEKHKLYFKESEVKKSRINSTIKDLKISLEGICPDFYNRVFIARKDLNDILVKSYVGIKFTDEDRLKARELNNAKREAREKIRKYY